MAKNRKSRKKRIRKLKQLKVYSKRGTRPKNIEKQIAQNINAIRRYEQTYKLISDKMSIVDTPNIKFQGDDMSIDLVSVKSSKGMSKKLKKEIMLDILKKSRKSAELYKQTTGSNVRQAILIDILVDARASARYKGMMTSAVKQGRVDNELEFFIRTVKRGMSSSGVNNKTQFINALNTELEKEGYSRIPEYLLR